MTFDGGLRIVELLTPEAIRDEGLHMHNCLARNPAPNDAVGKKTNFGHAITQSLTMPQRDTANTTCLSELALVEFAEVNQLR